MADVTRDTAGKVFSFVSAFVHQSDAGELLKRQNEFDQCEPARDRLNAPGAQDLEFLTCIGHPQRRSVVPRGSVTGGSEDECCAAHTFRGQKSI